MKYRTLGKTGLKVAEVGYGTWQLADDPNMWVGADLNESLRSLHRYAELGGNFIDTAWQYGYDEADPDRHPSEELIGKFLKEYDRRNDIVVTTKIAPKNYQWPARTGTPISDIFPNDHIERSVDDSLRSLGLDSLDLVQFHVWQDDFADEDGWKETIQRLTREGKVKHWGISINDYQPSNCLRTLDTGLIETIQFIFNIFHQKPTEKLLPYAKAHDIGLIVRVPLDEGGLTGTFTEETTFPEGDFRSTYFGGDRLKDLVRHTDGLQKLLGDEADTLPELALRYILSFDAVSSVIPGMRKTKNVEANVAISDGRTLSPQLLDTLKRHAWERNFYGPDELDPALKGNGYVEV
jgi:aryl-alcohol dehydrogenase-like predicted oxidoreductase